MMPRDDLRRLHLVNALFASVTGHDLYLAQQIKSAISFSLAEVGGCPPAEPAFAAAAARLLEKLFAGQPRHGFYHWDAAQTPAAATPLFARSGIMDGLRQLARFPESTLLVTNLRPAHTPRSRRWTPRARRNYEDTLGFIRDLAAARTTRSANLQVLFL